MNGHTSDGKSNQSADFDYVIVKRTGDATTTVEVNTTSSLASFSSAYTVTVPGDVDVYKAAGGFTQSDLWADDEE